MAGAPPLASWRHGEGPPWLRACQAGRRCLPRGSRTGFRVVTRTALPRAARACASCRQPGTWQGCWSRSSTRRRTAGGRVAGARMSAAGAPTSGLPVVCGATGSSSVPTWASVSARASLRMVASQRVASTMAGSISMESAPARCEPRPHCSQTVSLIWYLERPAAGWLSLCSTRFRALSAAVASRCSVLVHREPALARART